MYRSPIASLYPANSTTQQIGDAEVPWTFSAIEEEYSALRDDVGLFDYSVLGRVALQGKGVLGFLQDLVTKDLEFMFPERSVTGLMLDDTASVIDLVVVYRMAGGFVVETSPGNAERTLRHLTASCPDGVDLADLTLNQAVLGLEGPAAWQALGLVDENLIGLPYQGVAETLFEGETVQISRTGFTGEYGYKLFAPIRVAAALWDYLAKRALRVGYQALEVAMLEVRQPLLHREVDESSVLECGLNWLIDLEKESFRGRQALEQLRAAGPRHLPIGFVQEDGVAPVKRGSAIYAAGEQIGTVVFAVFSPGIGTALGLARTKAELTASGLKLEVELVSGERCPVTTVSSPYIVPKSWSGPIL